MSAGQSIPEKGTVDGTGSLVEDVTMDNTSEQDLTNEQAGALISQEQEEQIEGSTDLDSPA